MKHLKIDKYINSCDDCPLLASDRDEGTFCNAENADNIWIDYKEISKNVSKNCPLPQDEKFNCKR